MAGNVEEMVTCAARPHVAHGPSNGESVYQEAKIMHYKAKFLTLLLCSVAFVTACGDTTPEQTTAPATATPADPAPINNLRTG